MKQIQIITLAFILTLVATAACKIHSVRKALTDAETAAAIEDAAYVRAWELKVLEWAARERMMRATSPNTAQR